MGNGEFMDKSFAIILALGAFLTGFWFYHGSCIDKLEKALETERSRAEQAEAELAIAKTEKERLETALKMQEQATAEAQASRKVIYRTVQKEVAQDATVRDWYATPVPASLLRVLKQQGGGND